MSHYVSVLLAVAYRDFLQELRAPLLTVAGLLVSALTMVSFSFGLSGFRPEAAMEARLFVASGYVPFHLFCSGMLGAAALMIENEDLRFANLYFIAPVPRAVILLAKLFVIYVRGMVDIAALLLVTRLLGLELEPKQWLAFAAAASMSCLVGGGCGIQIASVIGDLRSVHALMPVIAMPQMLFGGIFMPTEAFPFPLSILTWVMPIRYGGDLSRHLVGVAVSSPLWLDLVVYGGILVLTLVLGIRHFSRLELRP